LWDSFNCWHETYVESYEFYEWELWHNSRSRFGIGSRLVLLLLNQYKRQLGSGSLQRTKHQESMLS
jgi:hypothetical protein